MHAKLIVIISLLALSLYLQCLPEILWHSPTISLTHLLPVSHCLTLFSYSSLLPWRRWWHPTPVLLPGKCHRWRSLVGCSPWGREESDTTERLHFHFSLSCIEEGNGNPLQCSCLENPRDGGAWWAAIYGVAQSQTPLKRLSSSSSSLLPGLLFFRASGEIGLSPDLHGLLFFNALLHYYILKGPL